MVKVLKRAGVIVLAFTCVLALNIKGTFGLEENEELVTDMEEVQDSVTAGGPDGSLEEGLIQDPGETEDIEPKEENEGEIIPETPKDTDVPAEDPKQEVTEDLAKPDDTSGNLIPEQPETSKDQVTPSEPEIKEEQDVDKEADLQEPSEEQPAPEEETPEEDTSSAAYVNDQEFYIPSGIFLDNRLKTKYNVAVPIDGMPSFITSEMIAGALKCQDETGYPASVTIAQIIQESGFGIYGPGGDRGEGLSYLAYQYNNLFGIKGIGPAGSAVMNTGEQTITGEAYTTKAGFRAYNTYMECIEDRTVLITEVYNDLIQGVSDANTFAVKIGKRWATDINYGKNLIAQMEKYDLYRLDTLTLKEYGSLTDDFADPCPGSSLTSSFGYREFRNSYHKGIDLGTGSENLPTYAAKAGTVTYAGWDDSAGNLIVIDHGNGLVTKYMHHDKIYVKAGQGVEKGQQIGLSGTTGDSTGNHLHFQVELDGTAMDPLPYLQISDNE